MSSFRLQRQLAADRQGTTAVEAALVLPVYLLFLLAIIEFGHAMLVNNVMRSACRAGARLGSTEGSTTLDIKARVEQILNGAVDPDKVLVSVKNASVFDEGGSPPTTHEEIEALPDLEVSDAESRQMFLVRAKTSYSDICILPVDIPILGTFLENITLQGQAFMRHE